MLKRIYADNFRCLVNFELKLDQLNLLLGENGTGKSTVFDVLHLLQQFVAGDAKVLGVFRSAGLTRWQTNSIQRFELELATAGGNYHYSLVIEHDEDRRKAKVKNESLLLEGRMLFSFEDGQAQLYHDDFTLGPQYPFDWAQSGLSVLTERPDNKKLTVFRKEMRKIVVVRIDPMQMSSESRAEEGTLAPHMENFASWYRFLSQEHQGRILNVVQELRKIIPGFDSISLKEAGEARVLKVMQERPGGQGRLLPYDFGELSDGQRVLVALYSLLFGLKDEGLSLFLDEPDNFLGLREIQPWLNALKDFCGEGVEQAVIISHHPEIVDHMALTAGRWFDRDNGGPTRVSNEPAAQVEGLKLSEAVALGWTS